MKPKTIPKEAKEKLLELMMIFHKYAEKNNLIYRNLKLRWGVHAFGFEPDFDYSPHPDSGSKIFSIVVFLYPENPNSFITHALGTRIYEIKGASPAKGEFWSSKDISYFGDIAWEHNRAFIFSQLASKDKYGKRSFHSYHVPDFYVQV